MGVKKPRTSPKARFPDLPPVDIAVEALVSNPDVVLIDDVGGVPGVCTFKTISCGFSLAAEYDILRTRGSLLIGIHKGQKSGRE